MRQIATFLLLINIATVYGQTETDSVAMEHNLEEVVFTAARSNRSIYETAAPVQIITASEIQKSGTERLSDILSRQAGITLTYDHGVGLQLMGLSAEYVMILINGQPLVGRTAGVLDLDRISVSNVKKIEIVRGPSSALYGSEALAGVINIITEDMSNKEAMIDVQYRRFNTTNISTRLGRQTKKLHWTGFANFFGGSGYDLSPNTYGKTAPPFITGTLENRLKYFINPKISLTLDSRLYAEKQKDKYELTDLEKVKGNNTVYEAGNTLTLGTELSNKTKFNTSFYHSFYSNKTLHQYESDGSLYYEDDFALHFVRPEWLGETQIDDRHRANYGAGTTLSVIRSSRYSEVQHMLNYFLFYQHDWKISDKVGINAGLRWDGQSEFGQQLNPKISLLYKPTEKLSLRASVGTGFKAPDPRQLYLNFSNPLAGYSVFGTLVLEDGFAELERQGQLAEILVEPEDNQLKAERSYSANMGTSFRPVKGLSIESDLYYNHVYHLIDTRAVARKSNGQTVFSYFNLNSIFTTGIHNQINYRKNGWQAGIAYEWMKTGDYEVLKALKEGRVFRRNAETYNTERVTKSDYFGLFNRPAHTGSLQLTYTHPIKNWFVSGRAVFRGKYGFADENGNQIPDISSEMGPRQTLIYISGGYRFWKEKLQLSAGIDNVNNFTAVRYLPGINGINPWIKAKIILSTNKH